MFSWSKAVSNFISNQKNLFFSQLFWLFCALYLLLFNWFSLDLQIQQIKYDNQQPVSSEILVLTIDNQSVEEFGNWPWNRKIILEVVDALVKNEAKGLALDIFFGDDPDQFVTTKKLRESLNNLPSVIASGTNRSGFELDSNFVGTDKLSGTQFDIAKNGKIYIAKTKNEGEEIMGLSLLNKTINNDFNAPNTFLLNPKNNLPKNISIIDFLDNPNIQSLAKDKYVFIGSTLVDSGDIYSVSGIGNLPGVYIHALVLDQLIQQEYYIPNKLSNLQILVICLAVSLSIYFLASNSRLGSWIVVVGLLVLLVFTWVSNLELLKLALILILAFITAVLFSWIVRNVFNKYQFSSILGKHLSKELLTDSIKTNSLTELGGKESEITVFFSDIKSFTSKTEKMGLDQLADYMNRVLGTQADIILKNKGVIDKYIGDSVMAFWGAPVKDNNHAYQALLSAAQITESKNLEDTYLRIGLHSGKAVVGNFGSSQRLSYTALGDTVNVASRLEQKNKDLKTQILASQQLVDSLGENRKLVKLSSMGEYILKGKTKKIKIYRLVWIIDNKGKKIRILDYSK